MPDIVELGISDYDRLVELWQRAGLGFRPQGRDSREAFAHQLTSGIQTVLGAFESGELIGAIAITHDSRKGWLNRLAVDPDYRQQGLGKRLIREAEVRLHRAGIDVIAALILEGNDVSRTVFSRAGYSYDPGVLYYSKRSSPED
ncbi:MAG: GNAT family N-acetyltransferase [Anaerolineales bacterium]|nr:GNAT family N-acetyltransferase [Anaerolineales bacterium]